MCITPAFKSTRVSRGAALGEIQLPPNASHCLLLRWREREDLPANSAKGAVVIIDNSLVTVFVTDVSHPS